MSESAQAALRQRMVREQLEARGIRCAPVLDAFARVPRHRFVPDADQARAYADHPLPIGSDQTISQPYIVAYMLEHAELNAGSRVLEVGTGSGYQTALLAELAAEVYTVERLSALAENAARVLMDLGYRNVHQRVADGAQGWTEAAPYDAIVCSAAASTVPPPLVDQLAPGGRLILPVGRLHQQLLLVRRDRQGRLAHEALLAVRFVPLVTER